MSESRINVCIVDDDAVVREAYAGLLSDLGDVTVFPCGEDLIDAAGEIAPDVVLLDIGMPGLDGYAVCRKWRALARQANSAVIFVSAYDTPEDRMTAYGAGGDDFVDKGVDPDELRIKVKRLGTLVRSKASLDAVRQSAQSAAFAAMMSMSEQGHVIDFLRRSFNCHDYGSLAAALVESLTAYGIEGMVQLRGQAGISSLHLGEAQALETSVLESMSTMGRIVEFRSRAVVNYDRASILVRNLPVDDADKVGRLKDHLAILAEVADARIQALDDRARLLRQTAGVDETLTMLRNRLQEFRQRNQKFTYEHRLALDYARAEIEAALSALELSDDQERRILAVIQKAEGASVAGFDQLLAGDALLDKLLKQLEALQA